MGSAAIEVEDLVRVFHRDGKTITAVNGLSMTVGRGEVVGLLGPNGAGKTTTAKILMTVLLPTSGTVRVLGNDVVRDTQTVRRSLGVILGGDSGLYGRITAKENMSLMADLYGVPYRVQRKRIPELLDLVGLTGQAGKRVELFSRGMKQRLHIARGLIHDPKVVVMDEPSNGLDPVGARELRQLVRRLVSQDRTVMLTTHYMHEAEELCDRMLVLAAGRIIAAGTADNLRRMAPRAQVITIEVRGVNDDIRSRISEIPGVTHVNLEFLDAQQVLTVYSESDADVTAPTVALLGNADVLRVVNREPTLEDAYVSLVSKALA